jgi:predicted DNA-binding transcriptional regulator AlpA
MTENNLPPTDRILRPKAAAAKLSINEATLWRWVKLKLLAPPIQLGPRAVGWRESALELYLNQRAGTA